MPPTDRPIQILHVEDNAGDVLLTREAFDESRFAFDIVVASDGHEALAALHGEGAPGPAYRPDIILLDLNLPRRGGREVLAAIKSDPSLKRIPVLVLTSSRLDADVLGAYNDHANSYIVKPVGLDRLSQMVRTVEDYWLGQATLPSNALG